MQIVIFKSNKNKSSSYKVNGLMFLAMTSFVVVFLTFMFSSPAYIYGYKNGYIESNEDRLKDIAKYQNDIELIKNENKEKMEFFSQKLITISSEIHNLNALGNKISHIAKLNKKEFNFENPKYIGGKNKINIEFEYNSDFEKYLDLMLNDLKIKSDDLNYA